MGWPFMFSGRNTEKNFQALNRIENFSVLRLHSFASIIMFTFNCYCWTSITMEFIYLSQVLCPLNIKGEPTHDRSHVALIAQLGEHCTGNAKVVRLNPIQSLKMFQVIFPVVLWLPPHLSSCIHYF